MRLRRFIYVFILPFLAFIVAATDCSATGNSRKKVNAAYTIQRNNTDGRSGENLLNRIIIGFDQGILVSLDHHNSSSVNAHGRDRYNAPVYTIYHSKWHFSSASLESFTLHIRDEIDSFIPLVRLLVFPKHWFW
jgi:hypothetical protein